MDYNNVILQNYDRLFYKKLDSAYAISVKYTDFSISSAVYSSNNRIRILNLSDEITYSFMGWSTAYEFLETIVNTAIKYHKGKMLCSFNLEKPKVIDVNCLCIRDGFYVNQISLPETIFRMQDISRC